MIRPPTVRFLLMLSMLASAGCGPVVQGFSHMVQHGDEKNGIIYYVGGAGPVGNVGSVSIPEGMQDAGYNGIVEVFPWQTITAADQIAIERNMGKGGELAQLIRREKRRHPDVPVHIIALSAGTAIATFALERLPEDAKVESVVFLASSLSSRYNMTRALRRVRGGVYAFYSPDDELLRALIPYFGTADRRDAAEGVAGLNGFRLPRSRGADTNEQYAKIHNIRHRPEFTQAGYDGGHIGGTSREFVAKFIAPMILTDDRYARRSRPATATQPDRRPSTAATASN